MTSARVSCGGAVSTAVVDVLDRPVVGRVVHASGQSAALAAGGRLLVLDAVPGPGTVPCAVLVPALPPVRVGEPVLVGPQELRAVDWSVHLERWWQPARVRGWTGLDGGHADPRALPATVVAPLHRAGESLLRGDVTGAGAALAGVLGLGPGSTPLADDAVAGWLLALRAAAPLLPTGVVDELGRTVAGAAPARTTPLSAELLRHAAHGVAARAVVRYVQHPSAANRVQAEGLGATSGPATVAGADLGRSLVASRGAAA